MHNESMTNDIDLAVVVSFIFNSKIPPLNGRFSLLHDSVASIAEYTMENIIRGMEYTILTTTPSPQINGNIIKIIAK